MGICDNEGNQNQKRNQSLHNSLNIKKEFNLGHKLVPINIASDLAKSVCKIIVNNNSQKKYGTGFFMIYKSLKLLISNYHVISSDLINKNIEIEIHNKKKFNLKLDKNERYIKLFGEKIDISIIEIKDSDQINEDIEYLNYDLNYEMGYSQYNGIDAICIGYPLENEVSCGSGKIIKINEFEFDHNISTEEGSSGSPIIIFSTLKVIGIHKHGDLEKKINVGTFIGIIFNEINKDLKKGNNNYDINANNNYIIAEILIDDSNINKKIRIINSYEEDQREYKKEMEELNCNEEEIKQCEIEINGIKIPFNYFYKFEKKGKNIIKYTFNNNLKKTNYMFCSCESLTDINLSNFNAQNITNMSCMFYGCSSLTNIDLTNFNTKNVTNMDFMFSNCHSLSNINLSSFNTENATNMNFMFSNCESLTDINLSNFITKNVIDMS